MDQWSSCNSENKDVFFDIEKKGNQNAKNYLTGKNGDYGLYRYQEKLSWRKRTVGYIPVVDENGKEGFIRIVAGSWLALILPVFIIVVCVSLFLFGMWFAKKDDIPGLDKTAISYHIEGVENTDKDSILLPGLKVIKAKENSSDIQAVLMNPSGNTCYFKYIISLENTGEILYTSGLIAPGKAVTEFKINKKLKVGNYPIKVLVQTQDVSDIEITYNAGNMEAQLMVVK